MNMGKPGDRARIFTALGVCVVGLGFAIFLMASHGRVAGTGTVDKSSDAYHVGYSNIYAAKGGERRALHHDPNANPYLTMPESEWDAYAKEHFKGGDNGECDPYSTGTGDWYDWGAGANQALQDIASGHAARFRLVNIDPDCD